MAITNSKYKGRDLYLMVETSAGVYAIVGGLRADSVSIGNEEIDITDKQDDVWKKLLSGGNRTLSVSGSGLVTNALAFEKLQDAAHAGTPINGKLVFKSGKAYAAPFLVTSLELNGEYNGAQQFSASLSSMNTPYIGIAGAVPTLDLNFAETGSIQPNIGTATMTFTRASAALYRDVDGLLKSAAANVPRFEHDSAGNRMGYLPEPQSTNLLQRSQELDVSPWTVSAGMVVTSNADIAPDGTATADKVTSSSGGSKSLQQGFTVALAVQTGSFYVKAGNTASAQFGIFDNTAGAFLAITPVVVDGPGEVSGAALCSISGLSTTRWTRVAFTLNAAAVNTGMTLFIYPNSTGESNGLFNYVWGAQVEAQPQATSYIATTSAQVTRSPDSLSCTTASIAGYSATEGALVAEAYIAAVGSADQEIASFSNAAITETVRLVRSSAGDVRAVVTDGGVAQVLLTGTLPAIGSLSRQSIGFKLNDFGASFNGGAIQTDVSGTIPTPDTLYIGCITAANYYIRPIKRVSYYNVKPSSADLVALTA